VVGLGITTTGVEGGVGLLELELGAGVEVDDEVEVDELEFVDVTGGGEGRSVGETRPVCGPVISFSITKKVPEVAITSEMLPFPIKIRLYPP